MAFLRSPYIKFSAIGIDNLPLSGGKVYTYIAGTNTPTNTWSDFGITLNSNPVDLNAMGQANIFLTENFAYKFVIKDSLDNLVDTQDNIVAMMGSGGGISDCILKDGTTTTTAQIPFAQGLSSALGMSITGVQAGGSAIKIPDGSWIRPQTEQGGFYLTNGSNPSALNSVLHLTNSGSLFSCGDGVDQFGQISIGSGGTSIYHNENGSSNSSVLLGTNYVTLYSGDNSNLVVTSNSATMYGGDSNLVLNNTYASLYQAGSGFYIDSTGIKPQGISPGTVSANSFVGLNSAGYLVKSPALSTTTAGVLTRIYLNPLDVIVNGTTYNTLTSDGAGATNETQSVSSNNTLETFATSFISDGYLTDGIIHAGGYTANIWVNTNNCNHEVDYYIDVFLTDALGVNISLLGTLASGGLVLSDNNDHTIQLTAYTSADVPYVVGQRVKFVVKAIANTTGGGAHTLSIKYGLTHASYIDIPVDITTDMVTDTRNGDILTSSLNNLQPLDADLTAIAGLSADGLLRKTSGVWGMDAVVYVTQTALDLKANIASPTFTGTVSGITSAMVGLGNVDNTSDANKPVSTATQTALNLKANIASPTFTGNPLAPTPALGDNDTSIATTAFVRSAINSVTAVASTATLTVNSLTTTQANITAQAVALTIASPTGGVDGRKLIIRIKDDNTARGITWNAIFRAVGVTLPLTTVAGKILYVGAIYNSTETKWDVVSVAQQA